ncbi:MAG TPA: hypothetical protein VGG96_10005 [Steroidobacteraceae bacterium]
MRGHELTAARSTLTRERVVREFDDRGPDVCRTEITLELEATNPEVLDIATRCARDVGDFHRMMTGFCMFYRLLAAEAQGCAGEPGFEERGRPISLLPRAQAATRSEVVKRIDAVGSQEFIREAVDELERHNPELLLTAHHFADDQPDYGGIIQGFALIYAVLTAEAAREQGVLH